MSINPRGQEAVARGVEEVVVRPSKSVGEQPIKIQFAIEFYDLVVPTAPAKEVSAKVEALEMAVDVSKNASFREESNFLADLKESERKALAELCNKVEAAIVEGKLFDDVKVEEKKKAEVAMDKADTTLTWDLTVLGWDVNYKEEFVLADESSYTIIVRKGKKMGPDEEAVRNLFRAGEPGKVVLTVENASNRKKKVLCRHKAKSAYDKKC